MFFGPSFIFGFIDGFKSLLGLGDHLGPRLFVLGFKTVVTAFCFDGG